LTHESQTLRFWPGLDYAFELPNGFRFSLVGSIGLIPGIRDIIDALVSLYVIYRSILLGIPRIAIARMLVNVGIEELAGSVPVIGDLFIYRSGRLPRRCF